MKKQLVKLLLIVCALLPSLALAQTPSFKLAVSEYPSWSGTFLVACDIGLIDGAEGKLGPLEKKWGVDIVVKDAEYDPCITMLTDGEVDAACLTNIDSLAPAKKRKLVFILPTSTSAGADACLTDPSITSIEGLKKVKTRLLEKSVSQYAFQKGLEKQGYNPNEFPFENCDPIQVGVLLQSGKITSGMTWNPVVLETLRTRPSLHRLFDSKIIRGHIIDGVTISREALAKPGGKNFAMAVIDTYYTVCRLKNDPKTSDATLLQMSKRFAQGKLNLADMQRIVKETSFFGTPDEGLALFNGQELKDVMNKHVLPWAVSAELVEKDSVPVVAYGDDPRANFSIDPQYIAAYKAKQ